MAWCSTWRPPSFSSESSSLDCRGELGSLRWTQELTRVISEIDTLRVQQATQEFESASTSKEAQALLNLNLKLQSTATKAQSKTIDLELKRLEASQLAEHMKIVTVSAAPHGYEVDL
jgi:hypothetical protein